VETGLSSSCLCLFLGLISYLTRQHEFSRVMMNLPQLWGDRSASFAFRIFLTSRRFRLVLLYVILPDHAALILALTPVSPAPRWPKFLFFCLHALKISLFFPCFRNAGMSSPPVPLLLPAVWVPCRRSRWPGDLLRRNLFLFGMADSMFDCRLPFPLTPCS